MSGTINLTAMFRYLINSKDYLRSAEKIEKATEKIDRVVRKTSDAVEKSMRNVDRAAETTGRVIDRASDSIDTSMRNVGDSVDKAGRRFDWIRKAPGHLQSLGQRARNTGSSMREFGTGAAAAGSFLGALAMKMPIGRAMAFETSVAELDKAFTFESLTDRSEFLGLLKKLGPELGRTGDQINALATDAGLLGISFKDAPETVRLAAQAATAFEGLPIEAAGEMIGGLQTKFQTTTAETRLLMDSIAFLADNTTAKGGEITETLGRIAGSMSSIKAPPELGAALSTFSVEFFRTPELAASQVNQLIGKLISLGLQADLTADPLGTLQKVIAKVQAVPAGDQGKFIIDTFGEGNRALVELMVNKTDAFKKTMGLVGDKSNYAGRVLSEFNKISATTQFKWDQIKASFDSAMVTVGLKLLPAFQRLMETVTPMIQRFEAWAATNPDMVKIGAAVLLIGIALAPISIVLGTIMGFLGGIIGLFGFLIAPILGLLSPFALVALAITGIIGLVWLFKDGWQAAVDTVKGWIKSLFGWITDNVPIIGDLFSGIGNILGLGADEQTKTMGGVTPSASNVAPLSSMAAANSNVAVNGTIGVQVTGPGKVTENSIQSSPPGALGQNIAGRPAA